MKRFIPRLSYANVTATLALFIALGGGAYAAFSLPRNSVGSAQLRKGAVRTREIRDRSIKLRDVSGATRKALTGKQGPAGLPGSPGAPAVRLFASTNSAGAFVRGNATSGGRTGLGTYTVGFAQDVGACTYVATLGSTDASAVPPGRVTVNDADGKVGVQTFDPAGSPADLPFHLIVAC
jgi:hypothetical protein